MISILSAALVLFALASEKAQSLSSTTYSARCLEHQSMHPVELSTSPSQEALQARLRYRLSKRSRLFDIGHSVRVSQRYGLPEMTLPKSSPLYRLAQAAAGRTKLVYSSVPPHSRKLHGWSILS